MRIPGLQSARPCIVAGVKINNWVRYRVRHAVPDASALSKSGVGRGSEIWDDRHAWFLIWQPTRQFVLVCAFLISVSVRPVLTPQAPSCSLRHLSYQKKRSQTGRWTLKQAGKQRDCTSKTARSGAKAVISLLRCKSFAPRQKSWERLVALNPNVTWKRDLSLSEDKIGDVLLVQGDPAAAGEIYRAALTLREQLADADPANAEWQRNISVSHNKIGDALKVNGDLKGSLESYLAAYAIAQTLVRNDKRDARGLRVFGDIPKPTSGRLVGLRQHAWRHRHVSRGRRCGRTTARATTLRMQSSNEI